MSTPNPTPFDILQAVVDGRLANPGPATVDDFVLLMTALEDALRAPLPGHPLDPDSE